MIQILRWRFIGDDTTNVFAVGAFGMFPISFAVVDGEVAEDPRRYIVVQYFSFDNFEYEERDGRSDTSRLAVRGHSIECKWVVS